MSTPENWDAIIIGGGPAGSGAATHLARQGRKALLLERDRFPRPHIGESLLPGVLPYLDALGVREEVEQAGFDRKIGQTFIWGKDRTPWTIDFRELDVYPYAYFVDRARFDHILLKHAAKCGVEVREQHAVTRVIFEKGRATGVVARDPSGKEREERARFVIDASGQSGVVARGADLRRPVRGLKNTALWAYWTGAGRLPGDAKSHILTASVPEGWIWVIPLGDRTSVGVVTSATTRPERDRLGKEGWYLESLRACAPVWELLSSATREGEITGARDWSYRSRRLSGPGILLAGDAACFIDPILSTGVHLAMSAAYWSAACVNSALAEPRLEPIFRRFYDETYGTMYRELLTQVKAFYRFEGRADSVYWTSKKILRAGNAVRADRAFLFITAGLLRNAAMDAPHDAIAQAKQSLGADVVTAPTARDRGAEADLRSTPPLVLRAGASGAAQLVTVRAEGLRLRIVQHEPRGLKDRPKDGFFVLELLDAAERPLALALVEERRAGAPTRSASRVAVTLMPYPVRPHDQGKLRAIRRALDAIAASSDDGEGTLSFAAVRVRMRRALAAEGALPDGIRAAKSREHRGGGVAEPPMTAVFEANDPALPAKRIYLVAEARIPPELGEIPVLRTRFLDVLAKPGHLADGRALTDVPEAAEFIAAATKRLWDALLAPTTRAGAFTAAEEALRAPDLAPGFTLVACGRLGEVA